VDKLTPILDIIASLGTAQEWEELLATFAEKMACIAATDNCTITRWEEEDETIVVVADYVSPNVETPFREVNQISAAYPLSRYPATARLLRRQTPLIIYYDDPDGDEAEKDLLDVFQWAGVLMVPIVYQGRTLGLIKLAVVEKRVGQFAPTDVSLCQILASQAGLLIENARLHQEGAEGQLHAEALQVIGRALASALDYQRIVRDVAEFAYRLVNARFVLMAVPEGEVFRPVATAGRLKVETTAAYGTEAPPDLLQHSFVQQAVEEARPLVVPDIQADPAMAPWQANAEAQGWRASVAVPLLSHNQLVGVLVAYAHRANAFSPGDVATLMSLASQAAAAIYNAQLFAELETQREALRQVSLRLVNTQEAERRLISRELHDELGQALTALKINLDLARRALPEEASPKLRRSVHEASSLAMQTLETARNMSLALHPTLLDDLGLVAALRWEIDRVEQLTGQTIQFEADLADVKLQPELEITIYRIVTEALTNIVRHAQATDVHITLKLENQQLLLRVVDDGIGFDVEHWLNSPGERKSLGLISMRERAELLGGRLELTSRPGHGTTVAGTLPVAS
jgi:two-component system NarL family sensor kinase